MVVAVHIKRGTGISLEILFGDGETHKQLIEDATRFSSENVDSSSSEIGERGTWINVAHVYVKFIWILFKSMKEFRFHPL